MKKLFTVLLLVCIASANFFFTTKPDIPPSQKTEQYFKQKLSVAISKLAQLQAAVNSNKSNVEVQEAFRRARSAYKQLELLIEYYYPSLIRKVNGPALPFADGENSLAIQQPQGFQVIEEMLFPVLDKKKVSGFETTNTITQTNLHRNT